MDDDLNILLDMDPDSNYYDSFFSENCLCSVYHSMNDFMHENSDSLNDNGFITIFNQNIRSLNANLDSFLTLFSENSMPDVFIFSET